MATHSSFFAWRSTMDREAWRAIVHRVTKSQTWLKQLSTHAHNTWWIQCTSESCSTCPAIGISSEAISDLWPYVPEKSWVVYKAVNVVWKLPFLSHGSRVKYKEEQCSSLFQTAPSWSFSANCRLIPSWLGHSLHAVFWPNASLRFLNAISPQDQMLLRAFSHCSWVVCAFGIHLGQIGFQQLCSHFWNFIAVWFSGTHLGSLKCSKVLTEKGPEAMSHRGEGVALS